MSKEKPELERRPGFDWNVIFIDPDDNSLIAGVILGLMTIEQVVKQAHIDMALPDDCELISISRIQTGDK